MKLLSQAILLISLLVALSARANPLLLETQARLVPTGHLAGLPVIKAGLFKQKLDHGSADLRTFTQRYWTTTHYARGSNAPVVLYLCGEGACNGNAVMVVAGAASAIGANVVTIEHRYYGKSQPFSDLTSANLKYLSTEQAIHDLVDFKRSVSSTLGWSGPWIVAGGSYAGSLAAYARALFPADFAGALASSAPVVPTPDLSAYDEYLAERVPATCVADIQATLSLIETKVSSDEGLREMFTAFKTTANITRADDFLYLLADVASAAIQLGLKDRFCSLVSARKIDGYVAIKLDVDKAFGDFSEYSAEAASDPSLPRHTGALGMRQWFYQSCTEYGLWQNASRTPGRSVRSKKIDTHYHDQLCQRLFGLPGAVGVSSGIRLLHSTVISSSVSHVFFTSGSEDPWLATNLSPFTGQLPASTTEAFGIKGASHAEDLGRSSDPEIINAKKRFQALAKKWATGTP